MDIALLNVYITFQKNVVVVDTIGNHTNTWKDYYSCHATVSGEGGKEVSVAGMLVDNSDLTFTVRYCKKVSVIETIKYRVLFSGEIYDILSINHMNYKKNCLKFKCKRVRR